MIALYRYGEPVCTAPTLTEATSLTMARTPVLPLVVGPNPPRTSLGFALWRPDAFPTHALAPQGAIAYYKGYMAIDGVLLDYGFEAYEL